MAEELCLMMGGPIRYAAAKIKGYVERATLIWPNIAESSAAELRNAEKAGFKRVHPPRAAGGVPGVAPWTSLSDGGKMPVVPPSWRKMRAVENIPRKLPLCAERMVRLLAEAACLRRLPVLHMSHTAY